MNQPCDCCEGTQVLTPQPTANRPGLNALAYRVGTHAAFLETMKARLSSTDFPALAGLKTRDASDPAIALLDAWATVANVLTFYQERIANEGYLRTATERRSILELARLVGYALRPGVSASVYLAYTLDEGATADIPAGARAQSLPAQGELPQSFETFEALSARAEWNDLEVRMTRPQRITLANASTIDTLYFTGTATNLQPNTPLLLVFGNGAGQQVLRMVKAVELQATANRTKVTLQLAQDGFTQAVGQIAGRYVNNLEALCVSDQDPLAIEALSILGELLADPGSLANILPQLRNKQALADKAGNSAVSAWLGEFFAELERAADAANITLPSASFTTAPQSTSTKQDDHPTALAGLAALIVPLAKPASLQPANSLRLARDVQQIFGPNADTQPQLLKYFIPVLGNTLYSAWGNAAVNPTTAPLQAVYVLRQKAALFGSTAPKKTQVNPQTGDVTVSEWPVIVEGEYGPAIAIGAGLLETAPSNPARRTRRRPAAGTVPTAGSPTEQKNVVSLDASYDKILPDSWMVVETRETTLTSAATLIVKAGNPQADLARADYGISGKTTRVTLTSPADPSQSVEWITKNPATPSDADFSAIRQTAVYAQSEALPLADETVLEDICGSTIELDRLYPGLQSGRWVIVSGERTDIPNTSGIEASELVMLTGVAQGFDQTLPGDKVHSTLSLASSGLAYRYKRDTVAIYGNVVKATHGETRNQVLGSGDGSQAFQQFALIQSPLTFLSALTPAGAASTLVVRVNDVQWRESDSLAGLGPNDRSFYTMTDDDAKTTVIFGNGQYGARLPTGVENITAVYRTGIGKPGDVEAEQISLLVTKPLGVKSVINPLRASGGADKENRDQARQNTPLATMALDRLVSVQDYADFARTFAGIGKSSAVALSDGRRRLVHITIAGADDIPVDYSSDLYRILRQALLQFGDPFQPIQVAVRDLMALVIGASVRLQPDYEWESVALKIRAALLDTFSFQRRELGQSAFLSEVFSAIQQVQGVAYVDVDVFDSVSANAKDISGLLKTLKRNNTIEAQLARPNPNPDPNNTDPDQRIFPAQLAFLTPDVPDTLVLKELTA